MEAFGATVVRTPAADLECAARSSAPGRSLARPRRLPSQPVFESPSTPEPTTKRPARRSLPRARRRDRRLRGGRRHDRDVHRASRATSRERDHRTRARVAVEPQGSILGGGEQATARGRGRRPLLLPEILDRSVIDEVIDDRRRRGVRDVPARCPRAKRAFWPAALRALAAAGGAARRQAPGPGQDGRDALPGRRGAISRIRESLEESCRIGLSASESPRRRADELTDRELIECHGLFHRLHPRRQRAGSDDGGRRRSRSTRRRPTSSRRSASTRATSTRRTQNPTRRALEENLAVLEGGAGARALRLGNGGDHGRLDVRQGGRARRLLQHDATAARTATTRKILARYGVEFSFVDTSDVDVVRRRCRPNTRLLHLESPTNPTMQICDIAALSRDRARRSGAHRRRGQHLRARRTSRGRSTLGARHRRPLDDEVLERPLGLAWAASPSRRGGARRVALASSRTARARSSRRSTPGSCCAGIKTLAVRMERHEAQRPRDRRASSARHPKVAQGLLPGPAGSPAARSGQEADDGLSAR